jgi:hypothetical protein
MIEVEKHVRSDRTVYCIKGTDILHREDGPAIELADGGMEWYLNGVSYNKEEWFKVLTKKQKEKALYSERFIKG